MDNASIRPNAEVEILIVEDSLTQAVQLEYILEQHGYQVATANDGLQALNYLEKHAPTIIISDVIMPEMDGYQLCHRIKTDLRWKEIPFILLTMLSNAEDIIKGLAAGADNFVIKPYDAELLLSRIQYILANQILRRSPASEIGIEIFFAGNKHRLTPNRLQIIDLLLSTYESAVQKNRELQEANHKLQESQSELRHLNDQLEIKVRQRTEHIQQLNRMLSALRNVNKLVVREKRREQLLAEVCKSLIASQGFHSAWIITSEESGQGYRAVEAGVGPSFSRLRQRLQNGELPFCMAQALEQQVQIIHAPGEKCSNCPLDGACRQLSVIVARLEHRRKIYGALSIAIPEKFEVTAAKKELINELTQDISYALHHIEVEEQGQQAKEKLRQSEIMYRSLFENTGTALAIINPEQMVVKVNSQFEKISGYSRQEIEGKMHWFQFIVKEQREQLPKYQTQRLRKVNKKAKRTGEWEYAFVNKQGQKRDVFFKIIDIPDSDSALASLLDISSRKRTERDLKESNERLRHALAQIKEMQQQIIQQERLRALGEMASGIAHDFNNSLTPILGFSDLLLNRPDYLCDQNRIRHYLDLIRSCATDAAQVVAHLREFYRDRKNDEQLELCQLNELITETISITRPKWRDQAQAQGIAIAIELDLQQQMPLTVVSKSEIREALTNLIFNAVDAMPEGGVLKFSTLAVNDELILTISDSGTGMDNETCRRCIEPFFSTKGQHGTGLGLAMVYGIVQRHNGHIQINSLPGTGTSFLLHLPLTTQLPTPSIDEEIISTGPSLHILIAEDEAGVREVVTEYLEALGHRVEAAVNGRDALEKFTPGKFDLLITDRAMPEMSGDQLADAIKEAQPQLPVIMLTGFGMIMASGNDQPKNVDIVLSKPLTLQKLRNTIQKMTAFDKSQTDTS